MKNFDLSNNNFVSLFLAVALSGPSLQFLDIRYNGFEGNCETTETPTKSNQSPVLGSTPAPTLIYKPNNAPTQGLTVSNAAVAVV